MGCAVDTARWMRAAAPLALLLALLCGCEQDPDPTPSAGNGAPTPTDGAPQTPAAANPDATPPAGPATPAPNDSTAPASDALGPDPVDEGPWERFEDRPCPDDNRLSWENFGAALILEHCAGCHGRAVPEGLRQGAPIDATFDDPNSIRDLEARIWARAGDQNDTMPPVGGPSPEDRDKLGQWLACGAPVRSQL